jgi:hypothetical protein
LRLRTEIEEVSTAAEAEFEAAVSRNSRFAWKAAVLG